MKDFHMAAFAVSMVLFALGLIDLVVRSEYRCALQYHQLLADMGQESRNFFNRSGAAAVVLSNQRKLQSAYVIIGALLLSLATASLVVATALMLFCIVVKIWLTIGGQDHEIDADNYSRNELLRRWACGKDLLKEMSSVSLPQGGA